MEYKGNQRTGKQLVYFTDRVAMSNCKDDVTKILIPSGKYAAQNLNFVNCFLNNTPPKDQRFILHWGASRSQEKGFKQDVFEILTVHLVKGGGVKEVSYVIPVPVLFDVLGLSTELLPGEWFRERDGKSSYWGTAKDFAEERRCKYNEVLSAYCTENGIAFHNLDDCVKKKLANMQPRSE